jgi:hypothetical protein
VCADCGAHTGDRTGSCNGVERAHSWETDDAAIARAVRVFVRELVTREQIGEWLYRRDAIKLCWPIESHDWSRLTDPLKESWRKDADAFLAFLRRELGHA